MKSRSIQLSDLAPSVQREALRQVSRQLGAGNGPSIRPIAPPKRQDGPRSAGTVWFRVSTLPEIKAVPVVRMRKSHILLPNGQSELISAPGWDWFETYTEAETHLTRIINARRDKAIEEARNWEALKELPEYEAMRRKYNSATTQLDQFKSP